MCQFDSGKTTGVDAAYQLAGMLSLALGMPVDYRKLQGFILSDWDRATKLAHIIHGDDRRKGTKDRRA